MSVIGLKSLVDKIERLKELQIERIMGNVGAQIRDAAKENAPTKTAELQNSISYRVEHRDDSVDAIVFTPKEYAMYVEFGTGPAGEENHKGISPNVTPRYSPTGWLVPIEDFPDYADYNYKPITIGGKQFIPSRGQKAQPYLYPALKDNQKKAKAYIKKQVKAEIKKVTE